jgi:hypothetical protein
VHHEHDERENREHEDHGWMITPPAIAITSRMIPTISHSIYASSVRLQAGLRRSENANSPGRAGRVGASFSASTRLPSFAISAASRVV